MLYFLWIVFDVSLALRLAMVPARPNLLEIGAWALVGLFIAIFAWISDHRSTAAVNRQISELRETLLVAQSQLSGKVDMMALLGGETFRTLQAVNKVAEANPGIPDMRAAALEIKELNKQISEIAERQRRRVLTQEQCVTLYSMLHGDVPYSLNLSIVYNPANPEVEEYARQFWAVLHTNGTILTPTNEIPVALEGLVVRIKNRDLRFPFKALKLSQALTTAGLVYQYANRFADNSTPEAEQLNDSYCDLVIGKRISDV